MAKVNWTDGSGNWTTAADWSTGAPPATGDDAILDQGNPLINTNVGTVNSATVGSNGGLDIEGGGSLTTGAGGFSNFGAVVLDFNGAGGNSLTVNGQFLNSGALVIGNGKQAGADTVTATTFLNVGEVDLVGGTANAATLNVAGSVSTAETGGLIYGSYTLSGDALLEFGSGQFTGINYGSSLSLSGTDAFIADAGATGSNSALALTSNAGSLTLDDGASLTTGAGFVNNTTFGSIPSLSVENTAGVATTTTLDVDNSTAAVTDSTGALDSGISVSGNSLLEFSGGGQITSIGQEGSLSIDGTAAFVADAGATGSNSAIGALTSNAGNLSLDDGASLTTGAGFTSTEDVSVANTAGVATKTTLVVNNSTAAFEDPTGALQGFVTVSGNSAIEFLGGGQITSIGEFASLEISGPRAFLEDAGATGSNSALALASNAGTLALDDGASLTTAAGFTSTGDLEIGNTSGAASPTTLVVDNSTAAVTDSTGALDSIISVSGNSLLEFSQGGRITSIGAEGDLSLDGTSAFVADAGATGSNSALAIASNAGELNLDDGATLTTAAGFVSTGSIDLENTKGVASTTTLVVDNSTTAVEDSTGALDTALTVKGNSILEFQGGGQITANNGAITLDGTSAFIADAGATGSNSALALTSNAGYLALDDGASLTTSAGFVNNGGHIELGLSSTTTATSTLVAGSATSFTPSGVLSGFVGLGNDSLLEFAGGGQITSIGDDAELAIDGTAAFVADAGATGSNSAVAGLANIAGRGALDLEEGASVTTTGALTNAGTLDIGGTGSIDYDTPPTTTTVNIPTPPTTTLDINSMAGLGAAGALSGTVELGDDSLLEFAQGGQITSLAAGASLSLDGPESFVADAGAITSNSALAGLASFGDGASLSLAEGASITTTGALASGGGAISLTLGASLTVGGILSNDGSISLGGGWTIPTVLDVEGAAGFGTAGPGEITGDVSLSANSLIEFGSGQITSIESTGSLTINGPVAFVADAGATTSNSALAGLASNAGGLLLENGASVTTTGALTNTGNITLSNAAASGETSLVVNGTTAGFLDTSGNLDGNLNLSGASLLEFEQGGQITGIGGGYSLSIDGPDAFVADGGATTSSSALMGLAANAGNLTLDDGAVIATTGGLANTGDIALSTPSETGAGPLTILDIGSAAGFGTTGALTGEVSLSGNSLLEFAGGGSITSIGDASNNDASLSIDGSNAFLADANAATSNSALSGLASNYGELDLTDGAVVTTTGALANTGDISLATPNETGSSPLTILDIGSAAGFGTTGELTGSVSLSGNSLLEFAGGGQITSIGDPNNGGALSIDGANAFLADGSAPTSNSALSGLASNYGEFDLSGGAVVTTTGALANTGDISLATPNETGSGPQTILDIGSAAGFGTTGELTGSVSLSGNSLLEFAGGGSITSIGDPNNGGSLSIDGANAFLADSTAATSNSALSGLASNFGDLSLADGAVVSTTGALANTGSISLATGSELGTGPLTILDIGSAAGFGTTGELSGDVYLSGNSLLEFAGGGTITSIGDASNDEASLSINGTNAFLADSTAATSNSALSGLASNFGDLSLSDGASVTTTVALTNTGTISLDGDDAAGSPVTTLDIGSAAGFGTTGEVTGSVSLSGYSLLEFTGGGQITSIGAANNTGASLSIDGTNAFLADSTAATSNSALSGLASNFGDLSLSDGASVTTTVALTNTGTISLSSGHPTVQTSLVVNGTAAGFLDSSGNLDGQLFLTGNSLLEFQQGGQITGIGSDYSLSIDGADAFVADGGATTSNSALAGLANNAGSLMLNDGAVIATTGGLANTGSISLLTDEESGPGPLTILDIGSAAGFGTPGELTGTVTLSGNSLLEFAGGGSITSIGDANNIYASLSIDGTNAFVADATAATSNSALSGLANNFGYLSLGDGASVATSGSLTNTGTISIGSGSLALGATGTLTSSGTLSLGGSEQTPAALRAMALDLTGGFTSIGTNAVVDVSSLTLSGSAYLDVEAPASAINSATGIGFANGATALLQLGPGAIPSAGGSYADAINNFSQGDTIDLTSLGFVAGSTTATLSGTTLTVTNGTVTDTLTLTNPGPNSGYTTSQDYNGGTEIQVVCFAQGTRIATVRGDVAVEDLEVGDLALTAAGATRPIRWLGHRTIDCRRHPAPAEVWPVRVAAHAFGDGRPARDLFLSPGHPVLVGADEESAGGHLVPIMCLINGTTISRVPVDTVTYWHVELDAHDILLAEDLAAESYLDWGDRDFFGEAALHALMNPDFVVPGLGGRCRPVAIDGAVVEAERRRLDGLFAMRLAAACCWPSGDAPSRGPGAGHHAW